MIEQNPLLQNWTGPFGEPPFSKIRIDHFRPAFEEGLRRRSAEIAAIKANPAPPSFDNTILALERAGETLDKVERVFFHLVGTASTDEIEALEREMAPLLARDGAAIMLDDALFSRVDAVYAGLPASGLDAEARRLVDRRRLAFTRAGAGLSPDRKQRLAEISERLATLSAVFAQNVLADEKAYALILESPDDLAGLPPEFLSAAERVAEERGHPGKHAVTLTRSSIEPFLQFSTRRDLREKVWRAFVARGAGGAEHDNARAMSEIVALRAEKAQLLGYANYAEHKLADTMAKTPQAATDLMRRVWAPARKSALVEAKILQTMIADEGGNFELRPWDWRYYAEKRRKAVYDLDEGAIKAHMPLNNIIAAAFNVAGKLFDVQFKERRDVDLPHPDARAWEVTAQGRPVALFIGDYFARPDKHSGAWMNSFRDQHRLDGVVTPIVFNAMNCARGREGEACLLSHDDARTLFHEFGHALHGMLSDVTYPYLSGTSVARDFVEFPSQLYEHWLDQPEVLEKFARHHETGEPMPRSLIDALHAARTYGQAHATVEFLASAFTDMAAHSLAAADGVDVAALQATELAALGMPEAIVARHSAPHFGHIFAGDGYSAGYYSYLWSEVLDADGFEAFVESGDVFNPELAAKLKTYVYAAGDKRPPDEAYVAFRGRAPAPEALLRKRGFVEAAE